MHRTRPQIPRDGLAGLKDNWKTDAMSGFLVFLIALPLCLGISMASGFPPIAGIMTAIVGGLLATFLGHAPLTIKGPAAGLIVIAVGAVEELGRGNAMHGYRLTLAVIVVSGLIQIGFGLIRAGTVGDFFPSSAVHGMLAAIGIIIVAKQFPTLIGARPESSSTLALIFEIPRLLPRMNPEVALIGLVSLAILFGFPLIKNPYAKMVPVPMIVLLVAVPLGMYFDLNHEHRYVFLNHQSYAIGPRYLVTLPNSLIHAITTPDFSQIFTSTSIKYIAMFAVVGTLESMISAKAIDMLDPYKRKSDLDKDTISVGIANTLCGLIGGLPMISEIVRSSANINNGARTRWANFFHGLWLLVFVAFAPSLIHLIPLSALAAMLIYTGYRLASPKEFYKTYKIGPEQLVIFLSTVIATLATDLLVGIATGILVKAAIHAINGVPLKSFFKPFLTIKRENDAFVVDVQHSAVFSNYVGLRRRLLALDPSMDVVIDFTGARVVDHTVMERISELVEHFADQGRRLHVRGLEHHRPVSAHPYAARRKVRVAI